jgi:hypothetical protein
VLAGMDIERDENKSNTSPLKGGNVAQVHANSQCDNEKKTMFD